MKSFIAIVFAFACAACANNDPTCAGDSCVCTAEAPCEHTCSPGGAPCHVECAAGQTCDVTCAAGEGCHVEAMQAAPPVHIDCANATDCHVTCPATGCTVTNCVTDCAVTCGFTGVSTKNGTTATCP